MINYFTLTKKERELYDLEQREMKLQKINSVERYLTEQNNVYWLGRLNKTKTFEGKYQVACKVNIVWNLKLVAMLK